MLKGRKQKYSERWPKKIMNAKIPVLMSTLAATRLKELANEIRREQRTRQPEKENNHGAIF